MTLKEAIGNDEQKKKKKNPIYFFIISFIMVIVICIGIFSVFAIVTNKQSENAINEIGTLYMSGLNERISMHFEATIDSRLQRVEYLVQTISPQSDYDAMCEQLIYGAQARGLDYVGLYAEDGTFETIFGEPIELSDPQPFLDSMKNGEKKIAVGTSDTGKDYVVLGISANYPMKNGKKCIALTAAITVDYIKQLLALDNNSLVYSHMIRRDGTFVIKSQEVEATNYFDMISEYFLENSDKSPDTYVQELKTAMENEEDYSALFYLPNDRRHIYCTSLPYSEWYLITVMPYGSLDYTINYLDRSNNTLLIISIALILAILFAIFVIYFRFTQKQINELEKTRLEAVSASKAKSEFLSNMSHDIRTPMNAILGMTAIAIANVENENQVRNCLKKITISGKHLLGLINDILDMSKIESGKMTLSVEQVSLSEMMEGIVNIVQPQIKEKNLAFDIFIHNIETENVYCDSVRFNQMLINLLSNAVKFTPEGGAVNVSLEEEKSPVGEDYVRIHLRVKDTGIGMSKEFKEKIFDSFAREDNKRVHKTEGTGLGMAITKYIVDAMNGSIKVHSEPGKGSEFHVTLDLEKAFVPEEDMILPDWNMLLVDDDEELCKSTVSSLDAIGIKSDWTLDGETAIAMVEDRHKRHNDYHIILLDWRLPGIDGIETARRIRRQMGEDIPILLISAYDWSDIEQEARDAGVNGFISKPLFKSTLFYGLKPYTADYNQISEMNFNLETDFKGANILVAEDNELNWEIANELLSPLGLTMEWAENGQICVDKFNQSPEGYYSAVLMDIRMPVMNGYEAAKAIRALNRSDSDIPIIAMTADAFSEDIQRCLDCGMNEHIAKPIDVKEVAKLLDRFLN